MKNKSYTMTKLSGWLASLLILIGLLGNSANAQTTVQIGTGTLTTTSFPIRSCYGYSYTQMLYTSAEIVAGGYTGPGTISKIRFYYATAVSPTTTYDNWTVYLGNTTLTSLTSGAANFTPASAMDMCFSGLVTFPAAGNWMEITLSTPFNYTGGNLLVAIDENAASYTCSAGWRYTSTTGVTSVRQLYSDTYNPDPALLPGSYLGVSTSSTSRPNLQFDIGSASACSGTPTPGNTISSVAGACSGSSFNLSLQNSTSGSGVTYQWQSSPDGVNWTNFGTSAASQTVSQTAATYYQCLVTCSGNTGTSTPVNVAVNPFYLCYCSAVPTSIDAQGAVDFQIGSWSNPNVSTSTYQNFTGVAPTSLYQNSTVSATVTLQTGYTYRCRVFIDFNQDGDFADAGEMNDLGLSSSTNPTTQTGNIVVPAGALTGLTGMRLVVTDDDAANNPCYSSSYANVEDYLVNIIPPPACSGTPAAATALTSAAYICPGSAAVLSLSGVPLETGYDYQWEESSDNVNFTPISGANSNTYSASPTALTYYRCVVTCSNSGLSKESSSISVDFDGSANAGTISGPTAGITYSPLYYSTDTYTGDLQWQTATSAGGPWSDVATGTLDNITLTASTAGSFYVRLRAASVTCTTYSNVINIVVTVAGDNVCDASSVSIGENGPFTNVGATTQAGEAQAPQGPSCNGNNNWCSAPSGTINNTVWFTFTVPTGGSGRYGFAVPGWDSQVAVWKASACSDLTSGLGTLWAANDDSSGSPYNAYARGFCLEEGETVYIQVDGYGTTTNSGFTLRIDDFGPADDASFSGLPATICANAAAVTLVPVTAGGTFSGAGITVDSFDPAAAGAGFHTITYALSGLDTCVTTSQIIEVVAPAYTYYADADGDGYGAGASISSCDASAPSGYSASNTDCNDGDISINPGATETCNFIDDDCDGNIDNGFDLDGDGFTTCEGDCDDNNNAVYPGATEVCNGLDDDCNLSIDDGLTFITYYADVDGDTYGDAGSTASTCDGAPSGYVSDNTDCNDNNPSANPAGTEVCNSIDDDCDGLIDENLLVAGPISGPAVQCVAVVTGSATYSIASVADASTYTWSVPAGMTILSGQGTTSIFVSWTPIAAHNGIIGNLTVTPSNACGAGTSSSVLIDINYTKPVMPNSVSGPVKVCPGDVATYSTNMIARASYFVWSVPAGMTITSGASSNVITVSVGAGYAGGTVSVSGANACGVGSARLRAVTVNTPGVSASISGQASGVCGATGVAYTCAAVVGATSYNWSVPAGATIVSGNGTSSISVDFSGSYAGGSFTVTASNACGTGAARSLTVSGAPGQPGPISGDQSICPGQSNVPYSVSTVAGASLYNWTVPSIASIASGQGTKDIYVNWGTNPTTGQQVTVSASNACGSGPVRILNGIAIDLGNCIRIGETGAATGLNIYPNPATEVATIVFNGTEGADFNLNLVDVAGRVVMSERGTAVDGQNQRNVVVSEMASGVYFLTIQMNGTSEQIRVMVD